MTISEQREHKRQNVAITAAADSLLAVCALQTGEDPYEAMNRALAALGSIMRRVETEAAGDHHVV